MKKVINQVDYSLKGQLINADEKVIITQVIKKDSTEEDKIEMNEFIGDIISFCNNNMNKEIELKLNLKVVE